MKTTGWLLILVCTLSLAVSAQEDNEGGAAATIRALERQWIVAQAEGDNRALGMIFDNALVYIEYGKLVTKGEYLTRVHAGNPGQGEIVNEPMTVRIFGNTAIVVGTYREKGMKNGKLFLRRWRFVDTWVYKKAGWVLVAAGAAPIKR